MNTFELNCLLKHALSKTTSNVNFLGVFAINELDSVRKDITISDYPVCYVGNTHPSDQPGEHWLAFYWPNVKHCEFFDSYGLSPSNYQLELDAPPSVKVTSNSRLLQSLTSNVCGAHCVWFLVLRSNGHSFQQTIDSASTKSLAANDALVKSRIQQLKVQLNLTHSCTSVFCPSGVQCCTSKKSWCQTNDLV